MSEHTKADAPQQTEVERLLRQLEGEIGGGAAWTPHIARIMERIRTTLRSAPVVEIGTSGAAWLEGEIAGHRSVDAGRYVLLEAYRARQGDDG